MTMIVSGRPSSRLSQPNSTLPRMRAPGATVSLAAFTSPLTKAPGSITTSPAIETVPFTCPATRRFPSPFTFPSTSRSRATNDSAGACGVILHLLHNEQID